MDRLVASSEFCQATEKNDANLYAPMERKVIATPWHCEHRIVSASEPGVLSLKLII
jgi:hypothetical protein